MAQARRTAGSKPKADQSRGMQIEFDGQTYVVRQSDMTGQDARALRQEVGMSFAGLLTQMQADPDIDLIAAFIWLARRIKGDVITYDAILDSIGYESDIDVKLEDKRTAAAVEDDSPEA
jgi:hypothetical protein